MHVPAGPRRHGEAPVHGLSGRSCVRPLGRSLGLRRRGLLRRGLRLCLILGASLSRMRHLRQRSCLAWHSAPASRLIRLSRRASARTEARTMAVDLAVPAEAMRGRHSFGDDHLDVDREVPDRGPAQPVIAEMAALLRDTRGSMFLGGSVLSALTIGIALEAAFSPSVLRPHRGQRGGLGLGAGQPDAQRGPRPPGADSPGRHLDLHHRGVLFDLDRGGPSRGLRPRLPSSSRPVGRRSPHGLSGPGRPALPRGLSNRLRMAHGRTNVGIYPHAGM